MVGDKLINLFYTSATDDKMVMLIDELGLEQPVMDEDYNFYKEASTSDNNNVGVDLTFYDLKECNETGNPCLDKISWNHDNIISLPFKLKLGFTYAECIATLKKPADFQDKRNSTSKAWIIENKYIISIHFKDKSLNKIRSAVVLAYRESDSKLLYGYISNKN